ncbi:MAG: DUF4870 domain-containing protein [Phycisphaeraceae bacterium]|nr:DUF4870 domain-containing protein [Phycisphaeraceae bacterium]
MTGTPGPATPHQKDPAGHAAALPAPPIGTAWLPTGRLRRTDLSNSDRNLAALMHLAPFLGFWLGPLAFALPLIPWLVRRSDSVFIDDHGRELANLAISVLILSIALTITGIGILLLLPYWIVVAISLVRGAIAGSRAEYFRYPVTVRLIG